MRFGDADERRRLCFLQTDAEVLCPHAGVDQHDDGAGFEQREREGVEFEARLDHQHGTRAALDADAFETGGEAIGFGVEFGESEVTIGHASERIEAVRLDNGERLRLAQGHRGNVDGDVDDASEGGVMLRLVAVQATSFERASV